MDIPTSPRNTDSPSAKTPRPNPHSTAHTHRTSLTTIIHQFSLSGSLSGSLSSSLHKLEPLRHQLRNILILMLQQPQRKRDIVPLALGITPRQPRGELVGQLLGVFILHGERR